MTSAYFGGDVGVDRGFPYLSWRQIDARAFGARRAVRGAGKFEFPVPIDQPTAILFRQLASPNYETLFFVRRATAAGFRPMIVEYHFDRISVHNPYKRALLTQRVIRGRNRNGRPIFRRNNLVDHSIADGQRICDITTRAGESLIALHRSYMNRAFRNAPPLCLDLSNCFGAYANGAPEYYLDFFRLFVNSKAVFVEDFVTQDREADFFERVVRPAFGHVVAETGVTPQIVRMTERHSTSPYWYYYPGRVIS